MGGRRPDGDEADRGGNVGEGGEEFDALFREMSEELGSDWELEETLPEDEAEEERDTDDEDTPPMLVSMDYTLGRIRPPPEPEEEDDLELIEVMPGTDTTEQRALAYPTNATLVVQYQVEVATADGSFVRTEATGLLSGAQEYRLQIQDDFSFGFDSRRNDYEIILNPNATDVELDEIEGDRDCRIVYQEGQVLMDKPVGVRLDVYRIHRLADGQRSVAKITSSAPETAEHVLLPTDPTNRYGGYTEYMLGVGLAALESRCYAFSIYTAVKLARPAPGDEDEDEPPTG